MIAETLRCVKKNFDRPDGTREMDRGKLQYCTLGEDATLVRIVLQPGWNWSESVGPIAQTETCQVRHLQYVLSGRLQIVEEDGTRIELQPGDFVSIPPGHTASVIGNEPFVCVDFSPDMRQYAE